MESTATPVRVGIIDLYDGLPNEGMRAIRELLAASDGRYFGTPIQAQRFDTRAKNEIPGLDWDVVISSGGPGSPFDGEGKAWEKRYFDWLDAVWRHNGRGDGSPRFVLFICHSFQMMVRHFQVASVVPRRSESFGVFPVYPTPQGRRDGLFRGLADPFYAADFRNWQVIRPNEGALSSIGGSILALEKKRPHIPLERALMGIRLSPEMVGTQFHPEADPLGMTRHFRSPDRKGSVIEKVGTEKYGRIMHRLEDPAFLDRTYRTVIPRFLQHAISVLRPEAVARSHELDPSPVG